MKISHVKVEHIGRISEITEKVSRVSYINNMSRQDFTDSIGLSSRLARYLIKDPYLYVKARDNGFNKIFNKHIDYLFKTQDSISYEDLAKFIKPIFHEQSIDSCIELLKQWDNYYLFITIIENSSSKKEAIKKLKNKKKLASLIF